MKKRWINRALFLVPLVCVVAVWMGSYFAGVELFERKAGRYGEGGVIQGYGFMSGGSGSSLEDRPLELYVRRGSTTGDWLPEPMTLGFYAGLRRRWTDSLQIIFPLWLSTLLLAMVNWFVWRKTRQKAGRAFPVEPAAQSGESQS